MSFSPSKKRIPKLPENFQEVLATYEMNLNEGITVDIIRNLIYIYTIGMEYYDNVHKEKLQKFYSDKITQLYSREDVIEFLDKNPIDLNNREGINLFPDYRRVSIIKNNNNNNNITNIKVNKNSTFKIMNEKIDPIETNLTIKKKILNVDKNLQKIDEAISQSIINQMSIFEERKREMIAKKKVIKSKNKTENKNINDGEMEILEQIEKMSKENKLLEEKQKEEINNNNEKEKENENKNEKITNEEETEILKELNEKSSKIINNSIGQNQMLKEIEEYVQKNMDEMYKSLEELKASFADEIKEAEENGYPDIAEGLKEDLEAELENMKDQYEEQRRVETDKIREKYKKTRVF